jgi:hypothetical protein
VWVLRVANWIRRFTLRWSFRDRRGGVTPGTIELRVRSLNLIGFHSHTHHRRWTISRVVRHGANCREICGIVDVPLCPSGPGSVVRARLDGDVNPLLTV